MRVQLMTPLCVAVLYLDTVFMCCMNPALGWYGNHVMAEVGEHINAVPVPQAVMSAKNEPADTPQLCINGRTSAHTERRQQGVIQRTVTGGGIQPRCAPSAELTSACTYKRHRPYMVLHIDCRGRCTEGAQCTSG